VTKTRGARALCCLVFAAVLAAGCASNIAPTTSTDRPPIIPNVVVVGDSLAIYPSLDQSFPAVLQTKLDDSHLSAHIVNASVNGDTTADALRRFDAALVPDTRVLVLALGANDGIKGVTVSTVERNLDEMIKRADQRGIRVLLCGMEAPPLHGLQYSFAFHQIFPRLADTHNLPLVPFLLAGVALNPELNGSDWVHPNAAGARRIAETVWPYLEPIVRAVVQEVNQG
jgi:acyl-CoA thioesterase-1